MQSQNQHECLRIDGIPDHVHLLILLGKTGTLSDVVQVTKKESSKWIKQFGEEFSDFHWQDGYAAFSVSESNVERCIDYINNQKRHHLKSSFQQELILMLQKHRVDYDERYSWD